MQNREIITHSGKVSYIEHGDVNMPVIVCLHGLAGNAFYNFAELADQWSDDFHLIL